MSESPSVDPQAAPPPAAQAEAVAVKQPIPRGMILIALLFYLASAALVATAALPDRLLVGMPRGALFTYALALGVLATGLFRKRRWAWFATMSFVLINTYYLVLGVVVGIQTQLIGLAVLVLMGGYLLLPQVRRVYVPPRN